MVASFWAYRFVAICGFAIIAFASATACSGPKTETLNEAGKHGTSPGLTGAWKSEGYGFVSMGNGDTIQTYEVPQTTCVPTDGYRVFQLRATPDSNQKQLQVDGAASHMVIHRIASRPATCDQPTPDTPAGNLEVFAQTWAEHYISFDAKGTDWAAVVATARAKVTPATEPEALFEILQGMISPLEDAHTMIGARPIRRRLPSPTAPEGKTFDGTGIPPDIEVSVFAVDDVAAGRDPGLERARIELYRNR